MHQPHNGFGSYPPAPGGARFGAFIVDSIVIGIIMSLMKAIGLPEILGNGISVLYFALAHGIKGQTLGKFLFGLQVVNEDGDIPSPKEVALRETIGRFVSGVIFGIGYLRAFFAADSRAWHDMISKTSVVSLRAPSREEAFPVWKSALIGVGSLAALVLVGVYIFLFTSMPLKSWAENAELQGIEIDEIKGSIARGFSISRLAFKDEKTEIELNNIDVSYDFFRLNKDGRYVVKNISVESGRIKATGVPSVGGDEPKDSPPQSGDVTDRSKKKKKDFQPVTIERIDIAQMVFEGPGGKSFNLKRFYVDQLALDPGRVSLNQIWLESDYGDLNVGALSVSKETFAMEKLTQGKIKAAALPEYLKKDLTIEALASGQIAEKKIDRLYVGLFDRRLQVKNTPTGYEIQTYGLTPSQYLPSAPPLANVSLKFGGGGLFTLTVPASGTFQLRHVPFTLQSATTFTHRRGERTYYLNVNWMGLVSPGGKIKPSLAIQSNDHVSVEEWLADLYYAKKLGELSATERLTLMQDTAHFVPFYPTAPVNPLAGSMGLAGVNASTIQAEAQRVPASSTQGVVAPQMPVIKEDPKKKAIEVFDRACKLGNSNACVAAQRLRLAP